jgi:hypothetical protein
MKQSYLKFNCLILALVSLFFQYTVQAQNVCNPAGDLIIFTNYDGGVLNINVDQNIPNLKIGVVGYEATSINLSGPFVANVIGVHYAGFNGTNNPCGGVLNTSINGAPVGAVTSTVFAPTATLSNPNGYGMIICGYSCSNNSNQGGCNTVDQIEAYFAGFYPGSSLFAHRVQYNCWSGTYSVSAGGSCCPAAPLTQGSIGSNQAVCSGQAVATLTSVANASGGTGPISYQWQSSTTSPSAGFSNIPAATGTNYSPASVAATTYFRRGASTSVNPMIYSNVVTVSLSPSPVLAPSAPMVVACEGSVLSLSASAPGAASYVWTGPGGFTSVASSFSLVAPLSGSGMWNVTVTGVNGCTATAGKQVYVPPSPTLVVSGATVCTGQPAALSATGAITYVWQGPNGYSSNTATANIAGAGNTVTSTYTVVGSIASCSSAAVVTMSVFPLPSMTINVGRSQICTGETTSLQALGSAQVVSWLNPGLSQNSMVAVSPTATTIYTLQGTDNFGCSKTFTASVTVNACVAIRNTSADEQFISVSPNPAQDRLVISTDLPMRLELVNNLGQQVKVIHTNGKVPVELNVSDLPAGIYYLNSDDGLTKQKVILAK